MGQERVWTKKASEILEKAWYRYRIGDIDKEDLEKIFNIRYPTLMNRVYKTGVSARVMKKLVVEVNKEYLKSLKKRGVKI